MLALGVSLRSYPTLDQLAAVEDALCRFERQHAVRVSFVATVRGTRREFQLAVQSHRAAPSGQTLRALARLLAAHGVDVQPESAPTTSGQAYCAFSM